MHRNIVYSFKLIIVPSFLLLAYDIVSFKLNYFKLHKRQQQIEQTNKLKTETNIHSQNDSVETEWFLFSFVYTMGYVNLRTHCKHNGKRQFLEKMQSTVSMDEFFALADPFVY